MNKNSKIVVGGILLIAVILVAIGYAAIKAVPLNISGDANATPNQANFTVKFVGQPVVSDQNKVTATLNETDQLKATMNVEGLTAKGDTVTATYTIQNTSEDLAANLSATTSNTNEEYFDVSYEFEKTTVEHGDTTTIKVTVKLIKTPITNDETSKVGIAITADPQQPTK